MIKITLDHTAIRALLEGEKGKEAEIVIKEKIVASAIQIYLRDIPVDVISKAIAQGLPKSKPMLDKQIVKIVYTYMEEYEKHIDDKVAKVMGDAVDSYIDSEVKRRLRKKMDLMAKTGTLINPNGRKIRTDEA